MEIKRVRAVGNSCSFCDRPHRQKFIAQFSGRRSAGSILEKVRACNNCLSDIYTSEIFNNPELTQ